MRSFHVWALVLVGASGWIVAIGCESDETTPAGPATTNVVATTSTAAQGGSGQGGTGQGGTGPGGGGPGGPCGQACMDLSGMVSQGCENCISNNCAPEAAACLGDNGAGGAGGMGGGGGAGGAGGGAGGSVPCVTCGEVLMGGDPMDICPESAAVFNAFVLCVCGDSITPGACT